MKPINQTLLAIVISLMMVADFVGVYAVRYQYTQNSVPESIYVSDSNTEFGTIDFQALTPPTQFSAIYQPMYYAKVSPLGNWIQSNITMVYTGNDTWGGAVNSPAGAYYESQVYIPIKMDIVKTCLITSISIKMSLPGDADIQTDATFLSVHNPVIVPTDFGFYTTIQPITASTPGATSYNQTLAITPYKALKIYSDANSNPETYLTIRIIDSLQNGMTPYNLNMTIEIMGTPVNTWSLQDSVNFVLGASIVGNCILLVYMSDAVDFGGYRKDLSNRSGGRRKKDSWRK
jgi:hypothetical protein